MRCQEPRNGELRDLGLVSCRLLRARLPDNWQIVPASNRVWPQTGSWQSGEARKVKEETRDVKRNVPEGRRLAADEGNGDLGIVIVFGQFVTLGFIFANISVTAVQMAVTETG
jgi:hypothetical protein